MKALEDRSHRATVLKPCNIYETPARPGAIVSVDAITFANLSRKGLVGPEDKAAQQAAPAPVPPAPPADPEPDQEEDVQAQPDSSDKPRRGRPRKD